MPQWLNIFALHDIVVPLHPIIFIASYAPMEEKYPSIIHVILLRSSGKLIR